MPEPLATYRKKRDPAKTPEPMGDGDAGRRSTALSFVIQEHHARALHWDFRLERDGVLVSWALPKGLPESPSTNHLAVHTEDHPLEYARFEGDIPKGEYGGGQVALWDHGHYDLEKWSDREVMVVLHGERATGKYVLFKTGGKNWMIHRMDPAPEGYEALPSRIAPMHSVSGEIPSSQDGWTYEFIWDGVRSLVYVDGGRVRMQGDSPENLGRLFPELRSIGEFLGSRSAILDGAVVAFDENGVPSCSRLQERLVDLSSTKLVRTARRVPVTFLAFDLVYLDGQSLTDRPYAERREKLESLGLAGTSFACPPSVRDGDGDEIFRIASERGLLGVIAKRHDSPYSQNEPTGAWVRVQSYPTGALVAGGWTTDLAGDVTSVLLGTPGTSGIRYAGSVSGLSDTDLAAFTSATKGKERPAAPFSRPLPRSVAESVKYCDPTLVVDVRYSAWPKGKSVQNPQWRGIRPDREPGSIRAR